MPLTKSFRSLFILGSALALSAHALPPDRAPDVIESKVERTYGPPLWVSAEAAVDPQTVLNWELLGREGNEPLRQVMERQRQQIEKSAPAGAAAPELSIRPIPEAECEFSLDLSDERGGDRPSQSLKDLTRNARAIFRGVLRSVDPGFSYGIPGSLLTVEIEEVLKGSPSKVGDRIFVDHPVAHFAIGPYRFCNATKGFEAATGDEVLLFDYTGPIGRDERLYIPRQEQIFFESSAGGLFRSERLKDDAELAGKQRLDEVIARVRERLQKEASR